MSYVQFCALELAREACPITRCAAKHVTEVVRLHNSPNLEFVRGDKAGPTIDISVSKQLQTRGLLLADTVLRAAQDLGWAFAAAKHQEPDNDAGPVTSRPASSPPATGHLVVEGERIAIRIEERLDEIPRQPTPHELAREKRK